MIVDLSDRDLLVSYLLLAVLHHALGSGTGPSLALQCEGDDYPHTFSARTILTQSSNFNGMGEVTSQFPWDELSLMFSTGSPMSRIDPSLLDCFEET